MIQQITESEENLFFVKECPGVGSDHKEANNVTRGYTESLASIQIRNMFWCALIIT